MSRKEESAALGSAPAASKACTHDIWPEYAALEHGEKAGKERVSRVYLNYWLTEPRGIKILRI